MKKNIFYLFKVFVFASTLLFTKASAQTLSVSTSTITSSLIEGDTFSLTINLSSVSSTPVVVDITTNSGTADSSDYTPLTTTVTIPAGELASTSLLTIATTSDSNPETSETFTLVATVTSGNTSNTTFSKVLSIIDNDTIPSITSYNPIQGMQLFNFNESNTSHYMELRLSNPFNTDVTINFSTSNGSATTGDYVPINATLTIPAGQTSIFQYITMIDDTIVEDDELFYISAVVTSGNTINTGVSTVFIINDNDTSPTISLLSDVASEGSQAYVYARLNRVYSADVVFQFSTSNGTANSSDYTSTIVTKTIPAGERVTSIIIPILDDAVDEPMETFNYVATVTSGNTTNTGDSNIQKVLDNDGLPDFYIMHYMNQGYIGEFVQEGQLVNWDILLTSPSSTDTVIQVTTTSGSAGTSDYSTVNTTITIPAGQTNSGLDFSIATFSDALLEGEETFTITGTLISGNTFNTSSSNQFTILDNSYINAKSDVISVPIMVGGTYNILSNDTLDGLPLNPNDVTVTLGYNDIDATLDAQGNISIPSSTPYGFHPLFYAVRENANPNDYFIANISVYVTSPLQINHTKSYSDYNADGFVSVGDIIIYTFTVTNNGNAPVSNITFFYNSIYGLTTNGGLITTLNPGQTDNTTLTCYHIVTQGDINFGFNSLYEISFVGTYYGSNYHRLSEEIGSFSLPLPDGIKLNAFVDVNGNGTQEPSEVNFSLGQFSYEINNDGAIHNLYTNPFFLNESNPNTTYNLSYTINGQYAANSSCSVTYPSVTVATGSGVTTYNFPVTVTPYNDLSVTIHNYNNPPSPGFGYENYIIYKNNSNQTVSSGTINYTKDSALSIIDLSNGASITATGFTYNFTNLLPYETRFVWVKLQVPTLPTVALGQSVTNSATITTLPNDILPLNNNSSLTQTIIGAYDPNDKQESHGGKILHSTFTSDDYLTYTIRFENTGTANAINVKVEDELDAQLDETTLKMVAASADYSLERVNRSLLWKFNGINLPPSVPDTQIGHGYITFQIKPKAGFAIGDIIPNTAEIYFDFNPAIVTNTCTTEFVETLGNENFAFNELNYFPNPVKNSLTILNTSLIETVEITSILGQNMLSQKINSLQTDIDISAFSNGIYFVKVTSDGQEKTVKIVKE